jgi:hypothetical protein
MVSGRPVADVLVAVQRSLNDVLSFERDDEHITMRIYGFNTLQ